MSDHLPKDRSEALFVSDGELIRRLGIGERTARMAIRALERERGFPRKDPLFGDKRYWPAVQAFLDRRAGISIGGERPQPQLRENFDHGREAKAAR